MASSHLTAPALLAHLFLARSDDMRAPTERVRSLWDAVTGSFCLNDGIPVLGVPRRLASGHRIDPGKTGLLAAAESGESSVWQAYAWAGHGVVGVSVMLAPPRELDCQGQWADLERRWEHARAAGPDNGVLGEARIFLALLAGSADAMASAAGAPGPVEDLVRVAAPQPSTPGWWRRWDTVPAGQPDDGGTPDGILVWEIGPGAGDGRPLRRLAAIAPSRAERRADQLIWTSGDGVPSPLTRHLAHAAALRNQVSLYDNGLPARQLRDEIGRLVDDLPAVADGVPGVATSPAGPTAPLLKARVSAVSLGRRLTAMRHAVGILNENICHALTLPASGPASGPLADDRDLAAWFERRLGDEISLLDEAASSAAAAAALLAEPGPASRTRASRAPWVVVFTALGVEYQAIREYLDAAPERREEHGTVYEVGTLPGVRGPWQVALAQTGPGSTAAGLQLDRAISVFEPEIAIFLGVAGGRKDVRHGDVVAADTIYDYESGKSTLAGFEPRMRTHSPAHRLLQWARLVARENQWQRRIRPVCPDPPPASYVKPIVSGGKVIAHDRSDTALLISRYAGDAVAVETEGHGFLEAAYVNPRVDALVIRGISDLLTGKDNHSDEYWQPIASRHAAAFAIEFLNSIGGNGT